MAQTLTMPESPATKQRPFLKLEQDKREFVDPTTGDRYIARTFQPSEPYGGWAGTPHVIRQWSIWRKPAAVEGEDEEETGPINIVESTCTDEEICYCEAMLGEWKQFGLTDHPGLGRVSTKHLAEGVPVMRWNRETLRMDAARTPEEARERTALADMILVRVNLNMRGTVRVNGARFLIGVMVEGKQKRPVALLWEGSNGKGDASILTTEIMDEVLDEVQRYGLTGKVVIHGLGNVAPHAPDLYSFRQLSSGMIRALALELERLSSIEAIHEASAGSSEMAAASGRHNAVVENSDWINRNKLDEKPLVAPE